VRLCCPPLAPVSGMIVEVGCDIATV
jgi:hypothetical protein